MCKKMPARLFCFIACCCLLLTSCSQTEEESTIQEMIQGGYTEEQLELPGDLVVKLDQVNQNTFYLLIATEAVDAVSSAPGQDTEYTEILFGTTRYGSPYEVWVSENSGSTWTKRDYPWLDNIPYIASAAFLPDGGFYFVYEGEVGNPALGYGDTQGYTPIDVNDERSGFTIGIQDAGDLIFYASYEIWGQETMRTLPIQYSNYAIGVTVSSFVVDGAFLTTLQDGLLNRFQKDSGELTSQIPLPNVLSEGIITYSDSGQLYLCNRSGLYWVAPDGSLFEQLVDGSKCAIGELQQRLSAFYALDDDTFLVLWKTDNTSSLYRYSFRDDALRLPAQELVVFSLYESKYVNRVIERYRTEQPDVTVTYRVGVTDEDHITEREAIDNLTVELAAGRGPDIVILDGISFDAFVESGLLADLSGVVGDGITSGNLLPQVAGAYRNDDGSVYAIPSRFDIPVLCGVGVDEIGGIQDFVGYMEAHRDKLTVAPDRTAIERYYDVCAAGWFPSSGGALDEQVLNSDLEALYRLQELYDDLEDEAVYNYPYLLNEAPLWLSGSIPAMVGPVQAIQDVGYLYSAVEEHGSGSFMAFPAEGGGVFVPRNILSINAQSDSMEYAQEFVSLALSKEMLSTYVTGGLPVHLGSIEDLWRQYEPGSAGSYSMRQFYVFQSYWPSEEEYEEFLIFLDSLNTPANHDAAAKAMILEETKSYFDGLMTAQQAVENLGPLRNS